MSAVPRIHCHSAFKHYEMFHCNNTSGYGNSIFNTTYNFNGGSMCGGGFWGGLFGGLGMGLGAGLMNFLGGGLGMFGGGFGMTNMFGGGYPMMSSLGLGGRNDKVSNKKTKNKDNNEDAEAKKCGGKDAEYLHTLRDRLNKIKDSSDPATSAKDLFNDINAVIAKQKDDEHDTIDENNYKDLLADLEKEWKFEKDKDGKATKAELINQKPAKDDNENGNGNSAVNGGNNGENNNGDGTVNGNGAVKIEKDENGKTKINIRFAKHNGTNLIDDEIKGVLKGLKSDENGNLKYYIIDCDTDDSKFKLRYKVTKIDDNTYNVKCISKKHHCDKYQKLYAKKEGINFTVEGGQLVQNGFETVVSTSQKDGYDDIVYVKGETNENEDYEATDFTKTADLDDDMLKRIVYNRDENEEVDD